MAACPDLGLRGERVSRVPVFCRLRPAERALRRAITASAADTVTCAWFRAPLEPRQRSLSGIAKALSFPPRFPAQRILAHQPCGIHVPARVVFTSRPAAGQLKAQGYVVLQSRRASHVLGRDNARRVRGPAAAQQPPRRAISYTSFSKLRLRRATCAQGRRRSGAMQARLHGHGAAWECSRAHASRRRPCAAGKADATHHSAPPYSSSQHEGFAGEAADAPRGSCATRWMDGCACLREYMDMVRRNSGRG